MNLKNGFRSGFKCLTVVFSLLLLLGSTLMITEKQQDAVLVYAEEEGVTDFVSRLYTVILERTPDESGLSEWTNYLQNGTYSGAEVSSGFILSDEFQAKKMTNEEYVQIMYRAFFGREADENGLETWVNALETDYTKEYVFAGFANSNEFGMLCENYGITRGSVNVENIPTPTPEPTDTPEQPKEETKESYFSYYENEDGTVTIAGLSEEGKAVDWRGKTLAIPAEINGKTVARVEEYAFSMEYDWETGTGWNLQCDEVIFEGADTTIGEFAFYRSDMTTITLPENLESIEAGAFWMCYELTEVVLPDSLKKIGAEAFAGCALTEIELPDSLEYIGSGAFSGTEITELTVPVGITGSAVATYGGYVDDKDISSIFFGMEKLEAIYVEAGNESYVSKNGVLYTADGTLLVFVPWAHPEIEEFEIPEGVQMIGSYAFEENENIKKLRIPASLGTESFVAYQLQTCPNLVEIEVDENNERYIQVKGGLLSRGTDYYGNNYQVLEVILDTATSFTIPKEVTRLFADIRLRSNLEELYVEDGSKSFYAEDGVLFNYERTELVATIQKLSVEKYIIPNTVEIRVLSGCENLTSVKIPASVTQIGFGFLEGSWNAVIYTPSGSYAETYAIENGIPYENY